MEKDIENDDIKEDIEAKAISTTRKTKRQTAITDEEFTLVNEDNRDLIDEFLEYCESVDRSPKTIVQYKSDLRIWMTWIKDNLKNKSFIEIQKRDIVKFQNWCIKQEMSPARIRGLRSAASSLGNYIENMMDDLYPEFRNIVNKIPAPSLAPVRDKTILEDEEVERLLNSLVEQGKYQQACLMAVLAGSAMRKSEIVQCDIDWFVGDNVKLYEGMYVSPEIRTKGRGRLGKRMSKYIIQDIAEKYLELWIEERKRLGIESEALFVRKYKGKWDRVLTSTIDSWMKTFSEIIEKPLYAHSIRHYTCTHLKRKGVSVDVIRDFVGHNDSSTTEIYIDIDASENLAGMLNFMKDSN